MCLILSFLIPSLACHLYIGEKTKGQGVDSASRVKASSLLVEEDTYVPLVFLHILPSMHFHHPDSN